MTIAKFLILFEIFFCYGHLYLYVDISIFHLLIFINFLSRVEVSYTKVYDASTKVRFLEDLNELINGFNFS